jgi:hypothetical protein
MSPAIQVDEDGFRELEAVYDRIQNHAEDLRPVGWLVRRRWTEGEKRLFARRPWSGKAESSRRRYRYPVRHMADGQLHRGSPASPTMHFTGLLERVLTNEHSIGVRDLITLGRKGGLDVTVGIKQNSPVGYGAITDQVQRGDRPRRQVVVFDEQAHRDSTVDVLEYVLTDDRGRGST